MWLEWCVQLRKLGGSAWGHAPPEKFKCNEIDSAAILGSKYYNLQKQKGLAVRNRCHRVSANDPTYGRVSSFFVADCVFLYNKMEQGPEFGAALYI